MVLMGDRIVKQMKKSEMQIQKRFGERVRELRKSTGLSQEALALACDLDRTYVGGVETENIGRRFSALYFSLSPCTSTSESPSPPSGSWQSSAAIIRRPRYRSQEC